MTAHNAILAIAETTAERALIARWLDEDNEYTARQRAWQEVGRRRGEVRFRW